MFFANIAVYLWGISNIYAKASLPCTQWHVNNISNLFLTKCQIEFYYYYYYYGNLISTTCIKHGRIPSEKQITNPDLSWRKNLTTSEANILFMISFSEKKFLNQTFKYVQKSIIKHVNTNKPRRRELSSHFEEPSLLPEAHELLQKVCKCSPWDAL